jgi:hypothetical protein
MTERSWSDDSMSMLDGWARADEQREARPETPAEVTPVIYVGQDSRFEVFDETLSQEEVDRLREAAETVLYDGEVIVEYTDTTEGENA